MPTIHDQLAWEERMISHGVERYRNQQDKAVEGGRTHETSAGSRLLRSYVLQVSDHIKLYLEGKHPERRRNKYAKLLETLDTDKTALFALKAVINTMYHPQPTQSILINIGRAVEDELRFSKFQTEHKEYYDQIVRDWERKNTENYRHKHRVLTFKSNQEDSFNWEPWPKDVHLRVGGLLISLLMEVCDLVETVHVNRPKGRKEVFLAPTQKCIDWVSKHNEAMELTNPDKMPCIVPPADWVSFEEGGYYSPLMRSRVPLVKTRGNSGRKQRELLDNAEMPIVYSAINAMQKTPWTVNSRVYEVMREVWHKNLGIGMPRSQPYEMPKCPVPEDVKVSSLPEDDPQVAAFVQWKIEAREIHTMEKERVSQNLAVVRTIHMAKDMEDYDEFYYVYTCDFRGRVYCATSGLSPQGTDHGKALIQFADAKPLGERGLYWLKVHGANKWGEDKSSYDDRVRWIEERDDQWLRVAEDPIGNRALWQDADKPYQFLAFCFEYAEARSVGASYRSRLPIALDGSCNGLQHFSAMLRDEVGGKAVNLSPSDKPADIYQEVADVATEKLKRFRMLNDEFHGGAVNWLELFKSLGEEKMPRKLSKKPVMTLPYGSTRQACTETVFRWSQEVAPDFFEDGTSFQHALYMTPILWGAIGEVVIAARGAMDWIQDCTGVLSKSGIPVCYTTPIGFPVYQATYTYESRQIRTQINGSLKLRLAEDTDKLDSRKQRQGSSPNFVHSIDATHMMMCVAAGVDEGISSFAMIHDDFGAHACEVDKWQRIIREQFVKLHSENNVLEDFKVVHEEVLGEELPSLPATGKLDIRDVIVSPYFFG